MRTPTLLLAALLASCGGATAPSVDSTTPPPVVATAAPPVTDPTQVRAVEAVLAEFQRAIVAKDGPAMASLFVAPDIPFRRVVIGEPAQPSVSTGDKFVETIAGATAALEEKFHDVIITADATLAVLDAPYSFHVDGKQTNHGREIWTLVMTPAGWKIASVTWSVQSD